MSWKRKERPGERTGFLYEDTTAMLKRILKKECLPKFKVGDRIINADDEFCTILDIRITISTEANEPDIRIAYVYRRENGCTWMIEEKHARGMKERDKIPVVNGSEGRD